MLRQLPLTFALVAFATPQLSAQVVPYTGPSVGVGFGVYPRSVYGGFGYFPGQYNGFWTNGFSVYGPPVPTYGITPGAFGASDYRLNNNIQIQNGAAIGLGTPGAGGAGPRRRHWMTGDDSLGQQAGQLAGVLEVRLPVPDAEVFFENQLVQQQGVVRRINSPPIAPGVAQFYTIRARWKREGEVIERSQGVSVRAGQLTIVDFNMFDRPRAPAMPDGKPE